MKYKCKIKIKDEDDLGLKSYEINLLYKKPKEIFYTTIQLYYLSEIACDKQKGYSCTLKEDLITMNNRSEKQWLEIIKKAIIKNENIQEFNDDLDQIKVKMKKKCRKFTIEI